MSDKPERCPTCGQLSNDCQCVDWHTSPPATAPQQINRLIIPHIENGMESLRDDLREVIRELAHQCEVLEAASAIILQLGQRIQEIREQIMTDKPATAPKNTHTTKRYQMNEADRKQTITQVPPPREWKHIPSPSNTWPAPSPAPVQSKPERCPTCGSPSAGVRYCLMRLPDAMHEHNGDCQWCSDPWHTPPSATVSSHGTTVNTWAGPSPAPVQSAKPVQSKTAEQSLTDIGDVRRELFLSGTHKWNGVVRDVTAKLEHPGMLVDKIEVLKALATRLTNEALENELTASLHSNPELTTLREIYAGMSEFIEAAETMMEFLPVYSVSSAGHQRKERLKQAIQKLRGVLA